MKLVKKIIKTILSIYAWIFYRRKIPLISCDILIFSDSVVDQVRVKDLVDRLAQENYKVISIIHPSIKDIFIKRLFAFSRLIGPFANGYYEYFAQYILSTYRPKTLITFSNSSVLSIYFKNKIEKIQGRTINIAHSVTDKDLHTMYDFHYYFVFGQSSIDVALEQTAKYGTCKLVKTGMFNMTKDFKLSPNKEIKKILFIAQWSASFRWVNELILKNLKILLDWNSIRNKEYEILIKQHPADRKEVIKSFVEGIPNIKCLPIETSILDAMKEVSLVIVSWSNAALEASVLNRPIVVLNDSDLSDEYLRLENFFLPRARSVDILDYNIKETYRSYEYFLSKAKDFSAYHLEYTTDSVECIVSCITSIIEGRENFDYINFEGETYFL